MGEGLQGSVGVPGVRGGFLVLLLLFLLAGWVASKLPEREPVDPLTELEPPVGPQAQKTGGWNG